MHRQHPHRHCCGDAGAIGPRKAGAWRGRGQQNAAGQEAAAAAEHRGFEESEAEAQKGPRRTWQGCLMLSFYDMELWYPMVGKLEVHFAILQDLPCKFNFTIQLGFDMALNMAIICRNRELRSWERKSTSIIDLSRSKFILT